MIYISAWVIATSLMTLFSYLFYAITHKESREPHLLYQLFTYDVTVNVLLNKSFGWMIHYILGIGFLLLNMAIISCFDMAPALWWGLPLGIIAGIIGVVGWRIMFRLAKKQLDIDYAVFYGQLVVAHIVFCVAAIAAVQ